MNALNFKSVLLSDTDRYSKELRLPDYPHDQNGRLDREKALELLLDEEYGHVMDDGVEVNVTEVKTITQNVYAGKCKKHILLQFELRKEDHRSSFPVDLFIPNTEDFPMVVALDFSLDVNRCYCPLEELMGNGVGIARVLYTDVTSDDGDFDNGVAPLLTDRSDPKSAGKLMLWAYAAGLIGNYLLEQKIVTKDRLYVSGHSRLGKAALLAAAVYPQFCGVHSNNSGCSGVAISREKRGETIAKICDVFPYWFAPNYLKYANREAEAPFDQHYLTALISPRLLSIATALEDTWADTEAQFLSAEAASAIYELDEVTGLIRVDHPLEPGYSSMEGRIGFTLRKGPHYFSRDDWQFFVEFIKAHKEKP